MAFVLPANLSEFLATNNTILLEASERIGFPTIETPALAESGLRSLNYALNTLVNRCPSMDCLWRLTSVAWEQNQFFYSLNSNIQGVSGLYLSSPFNPVLVDKNNAPTNCTFLNNESKNLFLKNEWQEVLTNIEYGMTFKTPTKVAFVKITVDTNNKNYEDISFDLWGYKNKTRVEDDPFLIERFNLGKSFGENLVSGKTYFLMLQNPAICNEFYVRFDNEYFLYNMEFFAPDTYTTDRILKEMSMLSYLQMSQKNSGGTFYVVKKQTPLQIIFNGSFNYEYKVICFLGQYIPSTFLDLFDWIKTLPQNAIDYLCNEVAFRLATKFKPDRAEFFKIESATSLQYLQQSQASLAPIKLQR